MEKKQTVKGKVVKVTKFGAFVKLEDGSEGMIHISQISDDYVRSVEDYLRVGDEIEARPLRRNDKGVLELSLKSSNIKPKEKTDFNPEFEKMLKEYMRRSEESHGILKRRREGKK
ncbi:MAG: S1 RNA-binding domain-containing protein [Actinobacteria bacterium]|nr:S1 RNA-binding domain-containing protein [Actinomycetota bacterium]